ncbi:MAG: sigma-E processing peptidase SpoIIGA [Bacillota bacterium]
MYTALLFALNLFVDYFLLLFTAKLFHRRPGFWRLATGAFLGSLAVILFLPPASPLPLAVLFIAALMILVVFWPLGWLDLVFLWGGLFLVSFMIGGAILALFSIGIGTSLAPYPGAALLLLVCVIFYLLVGLIRPYLEERKWQKIWQVELRVSWQGKEKIIAAYTDTGNRLRDPYSQRPVIITYYRSLEGLLPAGVFNRLADPTEDSWAALPELEDATLARCFTLVPFSGLGNSSGMLLGFKPDSVTAFKGRQSWPLGTQVVLGLTRRGFGPVAEYQALLPPDLVSAG